MMSWSRFVAWGRGALLPLTIFLGMAVITPEASAEEREFRAGAFAMDVTPTRFPISSNGGMRDRQVTRAHDPLHARCLVLDDGKTQLAIAVCDSCMIPRDIFDAAKKKASEKTGIPVSHMMMSATHTHTAPTVTGVFQSEPDEEYRKFLTERIAAGVIRAYENLQPARIGWGAKDDPTQVFNRRWLMKPGTPNPDPFGRKTDTVRMNPGNGNPALDRPSGPVDPEVCILAVETRDGKPLALLANYSLHYVGGVPSDSLSADYFGEFARRIGQRLGVAGDDSSFVGIMSNGTSGNINNIDYSLSTRQRRDPFEQIQIVAASVADAAYRAYKQIKFHDWVPLAAAEREIELGVRLPSEDDLARARKILEEAGPGPYSAREQIYARESVLLADYPATVQAKIQAFRIGDLGIVSSPCETFVETGLAIKAASPFEKTFTIELANGYNGYLPTPQHHQWGGYETWRARSSYLAVDAEPKVRQTQLELLKNVAQAKAK